MSYVPEPCMAVVVVIFCVPPLLRLCCTATLMIAITRRARSPIAKPWQTALLQAAIAGFQVFCSKDSPVTKPNQVNGLLQPAIEQILSFSQQVLLEVSHTLLARLSLHQIKWSAVVKVDNCGPPQR